MVFHFAQQAILVSSMNFKNQTYLNLQQGMAGNK